MYVLRGYTHSIVIIVPVKDKHPHCYKHKALLHVPVLLLHLVEMSMCRKLNIPENAGGEEGIIWLLEN